MITKYVSRSNEIILKKKTSKRSYGQTLTFKNTSKSACQICISFSWKLHQKIHRNNVDFSSFKFRFKKVQQNDVDFSPVEIASNKTHRNDVDFLLIKITFKKYVKRMSIFCPSKICQIKYLKTMLILHSLKLHRKSTSRLLGNSLIFSLRIIHVISTSNEGRFDAVFPLVMFLLKMLL